MNQVSANTHFEQEKARLNREQRQAVETIDGPVMVLAGPGTGKTQVLAFRIAEILSQTDVSPRNILALTFTESGVIAMRERLVSLIGVTAYGVAIYTFHGFANRVINESGADFYKNHTLDQIDDIRQLKLIMSLIDQNSNPLIRPPRSPYFFVRPILGAIKSLKSESVTPEALRRLTREEIENLKMDPESISKSGKNKGDIKQSVKAKIEQLERTIAIADVYEQYESKLIEEGLYDYEDMILFLLQNFASNPDLKARYQEQFQYILVDEYQDTNNAQNNLIRVLGDFFDNPNVFVVGDDKQSIYRFQGASMANLLSFREWYPGASLISLQQNYRSGQPILDAAHALIHKNQEQLTTAMPELHDDLHAQHSDAEVTFTPYATPDNELLGLASQIKNILDQDVPASQIAVIYRENREAQVVADILARQSIPYILEAGDDVLNDGDVNHLLNLLHLAHNPEDEPALFRFLHAAYSGVSTSDLLRLSRWLRQERVSLSSIIHAPAAPESLVVDSWASITDAYELACGWYRYQANHNIGETVEHIMRSSGLLTVIMDTPDHIDRLHRLRCFFDDVKRLLASEPTATLTDLFDRIAIRQTYNLRLIASPVVAEGSSAVRLMTAHKSKGLEYDYVFIPHFKDGLWSNNRGRNSVKLPEGIVPHHHETDEQAVEEERRLLYVALTRARKKVFISCSEYDGENKKQMACQFLTELEGVSVLKPQEATIRVDTFFTPVAASYIDQKSHDQLIDIVTHQPLTPTSINTYLTCPMEYLYRHVYQIPGVRAPDQAYGTAVHKAIELWGNWSRGEKKEYSLNQILSVFMESLQQQGLNSDDFTRFSNLGKEVLTAYYERSKSEWIAPLATEYSFTPHSVLLDGKIPITGKIDKIETIPGSKLVRVIDYKTGRVRSRNEIEGNTASSDGDYKRQLVFYAVLAELDPFFPYTVGEATLAFIDDQCKFTVESFVITKEEREDVKQLVRSIYGEITALHFDHTPHKNQYAKNDSLCDLLRRDTTLILTKETNEAQTT